MTVRRLLPPSTPLRHSASRLLRRTPTPPSGTTPANPPPHGSLKPGSRKISPNDASRAHRKGEKQWKDCAIIEEEGLLDEEHRRKGIPRKCYVLAFVIGFFVLFSFFALILYGASKPQKLKIEVNSITFEQLKVQAGSDSTGVATDMLSVNSTVKLTYRNTGTFFGVHVTSSPVDLTYSQLTIRSGAIKKFYQSRKSRSTVSFQVTGDKIPLYGSGSGLTSNSNTATPVSLKLSFTVKSRAYVLGKLVKPKFHKNIDCTITYDSKKPNAAISLAKSCKYKSELRHRNSRIKFCLRLLVYKIMFRRWMM